MYSRLISFFLERPFPDRARLIALESDRRASIPAIREWAVCNLDLERVSVVMGFGPDFYEKRARPTPQGLYAMPEFPFDSPNFEFRAQDSFLVVVSKNGDSCLDGPEVDDEIATGWKVRYVAQGRRRANSRNALGFIDGTSNMQALSERSALYRAIVRDDGGSLMVYRNIVLDLERWEQLDIDRQERIIGRHKSDGTPLGSADALGNPSYRYDVDGELTPLDSHVRKSYPRRPVDPMTLEPDTRHRIFRWGFNNAAVPGLHFLCLQRDLSAGFEHVYRRWMCSKNVPRTAAGADALLESGVMESRSGGYFYLPADGVLRLGNPPANWLASHA